jgi:BirA family biotin operon repressor/biotin-[acetyl-CoA-carboxylase] ligase
MMSHVAGRPQASQFTTADLDQIVDSTFVAQVDFHDAIGSTNDRALELAREADVSTPALVLAETQTGGRGRGTNTWWAQRGALTFSLLLETDALQLAPRQWPQASLTAGLAVCEALEDFFASTPTQLKWPNDVFVDRRKVCGILIEVPPQPKRMIVIGIGINVNNSAQHAPEELKSSAIALCDAAGREFSLVDVLVRVLVRLQDRIGWIGRRDDELRSRWRERCLLTNCRIHVDSGNRTLVGVCRGIDEEGALLIETVNEIQRCFAGVVTRFER